MGYGDYVLEATEDQYVLNWESAVGRHLYRTRFAGRAPILEVGPGRCWFMRQAPDDTLGIELDPTLVEASRAKGLDVRQGSIYELPFEDDHFDGAFCSWLFEHLHEPAKAAAELRRVLRPGGKLCLIVPSERQVGRGFYDDITHVRPYTDNALHQLARLGGFRDHHVEHLVFTVGLNRVTNRWGAEAADRFLELMDTRGRRLGIRNRMMLVLDATA